MGIENRPIGRSVCKEVEKRMGVKGLKSFGGSFSLKNLSSDQTIVSDPINFSLYKT